MHLLHSPNRNMLSLFILFLAVQQCSSSCPHMMGQAKAQERAAHAEKMVKQRKAQMEELGSPPSTEPSGQNGAPGAIPEDISLQTTFIHFSKSDSEKKYAGIVAAKLREVRDRLRKQLRLTVDNEYISCTGTETDHYRCDDYSKIYPYHYLVIEDSARGAAVYSLDQDLNGNHAGKIEAAILDALSRHSKHQLSMYASPDAEKEVGFVRELSLAELEHNYNEKPTVKSEHVKKNPTFPLAPSELYAMDTQILEMRNSEGLQIEQHQLTIVPSSNVFDEMLRRYKYVFILFWTNVRSSSTHAFNLFARLGETFQKTKDLQLAVVNCHEVNFCIGLDYKDFYTIVAYEHGEKVGTQEIVYDVEFYRKWINRIIGGPLIELKNVDEVKQAKKGNILGDKQSSVSIATFPSVEASEFLHLQKLAELIRGRYYIAYNIKEGAEPSLSTYKPKEKKKRVDYSGSFDPMSLASFLTFSALPAIVDITVGFNPALLFRQPLPILLLFADSLFNDEPYIDFASTPSFAYKKFMFTKIQSENFGLKKQFLDFFKSADHTEPHLFLFRKNKIYRISLQKELTTAEIANWTKTAENSEPEYTVTYNDPHPLMYVQVEASNKVFGTQNVSPVPDLSIFQIRAQRAVLPDMTQNTGGGCPFMTGQLPMLTDTEEKHDEL